METKTFYIVSSLKHNCWDFSKRQKYKTEKEAIDRAKEVTELNRSENKIDVGFYVLKAVAYVGTPKKPIKVSKLK